MLTSLALTHHSNDDRGWQIYGEVTSGERDTKCSVYLNLLHVAKEHLFFDRHAKMQGSLIFTFKGAALTTTN
jgi:hypothetical protein